MTPDRMKCVYVNVCVSLLASARMNSLIHLFRFSCTFCLLCFNKNFIISRLEEFFPLRVNDGSGCSGTSVCSISHIADGWWTIVRTGASCSQEDAECGQCKKVASNFNCSGNFSCRFKLLFIVTVFRSLKISIIYHVRLQAIVCMGTWCASHPE